MAFGLVVVTAMAWWFLTAGMHAISIAPAGADLPSAHDHAHMTVAVARPWGYGQWVAALLMWIAMTVAMMLPTAAPAILSFADADGATGMSTSLRQTGALTSGYLFVWWIFGAVATGLQWLLASSMRLLPAHTGVAAASTGCLLMLAGLYQFSSLKRRCLAHCHGPLSYFRSHWCAAPPGAFWLGTRHGLRCLGCCWALMLLMLLGGAMSIGWTAALTGLMLAEKVLPNGGWLGRVVGFGLIGWGSVLLSVA